MEVREVERLTPIEAFKNTLRVKIFSGRS